MKAFVESRLGSGFTIKTLGIYNSFEEIDFSKLPDSFVLKTTHDSGSIVLVKSKAALDMRAAKKKLNKSLEQNYYWKGREYVYKDIKPRIIAEEYTIDKNGELNDYKFFCFNGEPTVLFYASNRFNDKGETPYFDFYDMNLQHINVAVKWHNLSPVKLKPFQEFEQMKEYARILSKGFKHVRVDFYLVDGKVYVGEFTFHHDGGLFSFIPDEYDYKFGQLFNNPSALE